MKGVDQFDQNIEYYRYMHRFAKWWKNCFVYLLDIGLYDAFLLYNSSLPTKITHLNFRMRLALLFTNYFPMNIEVSEQEELEE